MSKDSKDDFQHVMPVRNLQGMLRSRINEANHGGLTPSTETGPDGKDLVGYPKVFFEKDMHFKDKIELVLEEKSILLSNLAKEIGIEEDLLKKLMNKDKLPKKNILEKLSEYSGYSIEYYQSKPISELFK